MRRQTQRPLLLWAVALWLLALGIIDLWRSITLWQTWRLLVELGSRLSPLASQLLILGWMLCAAALLVSATGLWLRWGWARHLARAAILAHLILVQLYTWGFVRTGLSWQRRWSSLVLALLSTAILIAALTWPSSRRWLGLEQTSTPSTTA